MPETSEETSPTSVDLRPLLPPVRDQGERDTCLAFAVTAAHELARAAVFGLLEDLAEEVLHWGCRQVDGNHEPGSSFSSASVALELWGQPLEELWPYDANRDDADSRYLPPPGALDSAVCHTARLSRIEGSIPEIKRQLVAGRGVALNIQIARGFFQPMDGRIPMPGPGEQFLVGHAVLAVGFQDGFAPGDGLLILRNSWGPGWSEGGYGYLPYTYVEDHGAEAWIVGLDHPPISR